MEAMTPPTPDIAVSEERVNELREWLTSLTSGSDDDIRADLLSILDDYAKVKAENEELKKNEEAAYSCMMKELRRAEKAEAQLAKVCERNRLMDDNFGSLLEKNINLEEQLAKQAPLIEAVMGLDEIDFIADDWPSEKLRESADKLRSEK
jgi:hypothetical protein